MCSTLLYGWMVYYFLFGAWVQFQLLEVGYFRLQVTGLGYFNEVTQSQLVWDKDELKVGW